MDSLDENGGAHSYWVPPDVAADGFALSQALSIIIHLVTF